MIKTDVGIEIAVMMVDLKLSKKTKMIRTANERPSNPSVVRSLMDFSINGAWSKMVVTVTPPPSASSKSGISFSTPDETATEFPSGVLTIETAKDSLPLVRAMVVTGASS